MIRQYVGARYVPKFADPTAWTSGTSYEALTIVTYNNSSYTSKMPVPATVGNPADNPDYWALTGNYNAQVEAYREETAAVQEGLNETNQNLANETQTRESAVSEAIKTSEEYTDNQLTNRERYAIYLGNSYTRGTGSSTGTNGIFERTKSFFTRGAKEYTGDGTGFVAYESGHENDTFLKHLNDAINDDTLDKDIVTDIMIVGAWGESRTVASIASKSGSVITARHQIAAAALTLCNTARANFPNLKHIYYVWAEIRDFYTQTLYNINNTWFYGYIVNSLMQHVCNSAGMIYLGYAGLSITFLQDTVSSDYYHPNDTGYRFLSNYILSALAGGKNSPTIYRNLVQPVTGTSESGDSTITGTVAIRMAISEENAILTIGSIVTTSESTLKANESVYLPCFQIAEHPANMTIPISTMSWQFKNTYQTGGTVTFNCALTVNTDDSTCGITITSSSDLTLPANSTIHVNNTLITSTAQQL